MPWIWRHIHRLHGRQGGRSKTDYYIVFKINSSGMIHALEKSIQNDTDTLSFSFCYLIINYNMRWVNFRFSFILTVSFLYFSSRLRCWFLNRSIWPVANAMPSLCAVVLGRARKNRVRTSASLLASDRMTRPSQARARAQFPTKWLVSK
jgi:hypothetical protein